MVTFVTQRTVLCFVIIEYANKLCADHNNNINKNNDINNNNNNKNNRTFVNFVTICIRSTVKINVTYETRET